jgi:hypothetical protein
MAMPAVAYGCINENITGVAMAIRGGSTISKYSAMAGVSVNSLACSMALGNVCGVFIKLAKWHGYHRQQSLSLAISSVTAFGGNKL